MLLLFARINREHMFVLVLKVISGIRSNPAASLVENVFLIWTVHLLQLAKKGVVLILA
jgi:hypothetical protein